ncbi:hypothetical protein ACUSIJ_07555 [Pseudochelatococcus sp. B33]
MSVSTVSGASQPAMPELPNDHETEAQEVAALAPPPAGGAAAAVSAPLVLETSALEVMAMEPAAAAMSTATTSYPATSSGYWNEPAIITFSSLDMAAKIMGLDADEKAQLAALGTLTFRHEKGDTYTNFWTPVVAQRTSDGNSIYNFADPSKATLSYVEAGAAFVKVEDYGKDQEDVSLTKDEILALSSEDLKALVRQYGMPDLDAGNSAGLGIHGLDMHGAVVPATNLLYFRTPRDAHELTIILGESGQPIIVEHLDVRSFAKLTVEEQRLISALPAFTGGTIGQGASQETYAGGAGLAATLGLVTTIPASLQDAYNAIYSHTVPPFDVDNLFYPNWPLTNFSETDRQVFLDQLQLIADKLSNQAIYHKKTIDDEVAAVLKRFETAYAYGSVAAEVGPDVFQMNYQGHIVVRYSNVVSLDKGAAIESGFANFMAQERRLLELAEARANLQAETAGNRKLDVPTMLVRFQLYYNLEMEAQVNIKSEEVKQQNELLKTYAYMQKRVSELAGTGTSIDYLGASGGGDGNYQRDVFQVHAINNPNPQRMWEYFGITSMFQTHNINAGFFADPSRQWAVMQPKHPLEALRGITRPTVDIFYENSTRGNSDWGEYVKLSASAWSQFGTRLADAVTLINQESQIQMNDISAFEKEKNRYFEAGTNALSRLSEAILAIARNV